MASCGLNKYIQKRGMNCGFKFNESSDSRNWVY